MADTIKLCAHCQEKTDHTTITEGRLHICAVCGTEQRFKPGEKGPAPREPKPAPYKPKAVHAETIERKTETEGKRMTKLTTEQKADIIRRHENGEKNAVLATEFGVSENRIWYTCKNAGKKPKSRRAEEPKSRRAEEPKSNGSIRDAVARMVAEQVDAHLADLDARIEQVVVRMLK